MNRRLLQKSAKEIKYMWQDFVSASVRLIIIYLIYFLFMEYEICSQLWVQHHQSVKADILCQETPQEWVLSKNKDWVNLASCKVWVAKRL